MLLSIPALFPSISMVFNDYMCITSATEYSKSLRLLLLKNDLIFFFMAAYTIFQAHVTYVTLKIALNIQVNVYNKPCLYLFAFWHRVMYFF